MSARVLCLGVFLAGLAALPSCAPSTKVELHGYVTSSTHANCHRIVFAFQRDNKCTLRGLSITIVTERNWTFEGHLVNGSFRDMGFPDQGQIRVYAGEHDELPALYHELGHKLEWQEHLDCDGGHHNWRWPWWDARGRAVSDAIVAENAP